MSETLGPQPNPDALFRSLDAWRIDPVIDERLKVLKACNAGLLTQPRNHGEVMELTSQFDTEWHSELNSACAFTGWARFPDMEQAGYPITSADYDNLVAIFRGITPVVVGEAPSSPEDRTLYQLHLAIEKPDITPDGKKVLSPGYCKADHVIRLEFEKAMSVKRAHEILRSDALDLLAKIDDLAQHPEYGASSAARISGLRGLSFNLPVHQDPWNAHLTKQALNVYTDAALKPDTAIPYIAQVKGRFWTFLEGDEGNQAVDSFGCCYMMATTESLPWEHHPDQPNVLIPSVLLLEHGQDPQSPAKKHCIPVASIKNLRSVREEFFETD